MRMYMPLTFKHPLLCVAGTNSEMGDGEPDIANDGLWGRIVELLKLWVFEYHRIIS